jgi:hypothetical protein
LAKGYFTYWELRTTPPRTAKSWLVGYPEVGRKRGSRRSGQLRHSSGTTLPRTGLRARNSFRVGRDPATMPRSANPQPRKPVLRVDTNELSGQSFPHGSDLHTAIRRELYMILRNEEECHVEGEAQRSGDDWGIECRWKRDAPRHSFSSSDKLVNRMTPYPPHQNGRLSKERSCAMGISQVIEKKDRCATAF